NRLELGAKRVEARLDGVHALFPVRPFADTEHLLDTGVVRLEIGDRERIAAVVRQTRGRVPLGDVALVCAEGDLRVDRRRAAHTAASEERDELTARKRREPQRP